MLRSTSLAAMLGCCLLATPFAVTADWKEWGRKGLEIFGGEQAAEAALSNSEIINGLKEALAKGTTNAINQLGQTDGFLGNELVRIAAPPQLQRIGDGLRKAGQGAIVDNFETTLNRAAEQAVPEVADVFGDAIRNLSIADARSILEGGDQAATDFFRRTTSGTLTERILPLVSKATGETGVTSSYKALTSKAGFLAQFLNLDAESLDRHVTDGALEGLFSVIGKEEAKIRNNPAARTTDVLERVFGR